MRRQHRVYALFAFAWVLWMRTSVPGTPDKWQVVDSMTREDDCRSKAATIAPGQAWERRKSGMS